MAAHFLLLSPLHSCWTAIGNRLPGYSHAHLFVYDGCRPYLSSHHGLHAAASVTDAQLLEGDCLGMLLLIA